MTKPNLIRIISAAVLVLGILRPGMCNQPGTIPDPAVPHANLWSRASCTVLLHIEQYVSVEFEADTLAMPDVNIDMFDQASSSRGEIAWRLSTNINTRLYTEKILTLFSDDDGVSAVEAAVDFLFEGADCYDFGIGMTALDFSPGHNRSGLTRVEINTESITQNSAQFGGNYTGTLVATLEVR